MFAPLLSFASPSLDLFCHATYSSSSFLIMSAISFPRRAIDREVFLSEAGKLRASFSANAHLAPESGKVKALVRKAHEELLRYSHPDKYILPWMPGGTLFMRNPPLPFDVVFAGHVPEDVKEEPLNIDMTPVVKGEKGDGRVLVDSANKAYF
jgi:NADH dehydrogenase (ubiquinone) 1 beta subcomplex subunit 9